MIRLGIKPSRPNQLKGSSIISAKAKLRTLLRRKGTILSKEFSSSIWQNIAVRKLLHRYQHQKCCYCERYRDFKREADVEHFRPKAKVEEDTSHPGYWWLAYEWQNLFFSCKTCNQEFKGNNFPLQKDGIRARSESDNLDFEMSILPDLIREDPEELISYEWDEVLLEAWPVPRDRIRGAQIIKILGLDRANLNRERGKQLPMLSFVKGNIVKELKKRTPNHDVLLIIETFTKKDQLFAGFRRSYFRQMGLGEYISTN